MMVKFICYSKCTTCMKAKKWLEENQVEFELRDIKAENPSAEELKAWHAMSGLPLKKFFNTSGLLYKSMELKNKLPNMSDEEMIELLATDGMLVKRPLLIGEDFVLVGFKEKEWTEKF
ncbi:MAG: arsenate reductase family protein [Firmicutes bacterium]|nr:arsenate reductase family protein [Bacillota bacterium]